MSEEYKEMLERFEEICKNAKKEISAKEEKEEEKRFLEKIDKELTITEYDEIEYWLANVETLDNTDYILHNRKAKILVRYLKEKDKEIERLKDRIDRANNFIDQEIMYLVKPKDYNRVEMLQDILNNNDFEKGSDKEWKDI